MTNNPEKLAKSKEHAEDLKRARELLDAYHDRELTAEEKAFVENALAEYPELAKESSMIVGIKNVLSQYGGEDVDPNFTAKVLQRLQTEDKKSPGKKNALKYLIFGVLAATALAFMVLLWFFKLKNN